MVTRLHLIRHGATTLSAEDRFAGAVDVPLSDEGRAQARRLGERLAQEVSGGGLPFLHQGKHVAFVMAQPFHRAPLSHERRGAAIAGPFAARTRLFATANKKGGAVPGYDGRDQQTGVRSDGGI